MNRSTHSFKSLTISRSHLANCRKLLSKKFRDIEGKYIVEGVRTCEEAFNSEVEIREFIHCPEMLNVDRGYDLLVRASDRHIPIFQAGENQFRSMTSTDTPQGLACIVNKSAQRDIPESATLLLALDSLQDPGNLGTIIRTAEWFGVGGVILNDQTVDVYNPKVVRSTMGAIFRMTVTEHARLNEFLIPLKSNRYRVIAAVVKGGIPISTLKRSQKDILILGNEAHGLSIEKSLIDIETYIPCLGQGESLNVAVATGIALYQLTQ